MQINFKLNTFWLAVVAAAAFVVAKLAFGLTWSWWILALILASPWILFLVLALIVAVVGAVLIVVAGFVKGLRGK